MRQSTWGVHCGQQPLDDYLRRYASQGLFAATSRECSSRRRTTHRLAGYFTLSAGSVPCSDLPTAVARKLPRYPVPIALIGRLAVDTSCQSRGLGSILLVDACRKVAHAGTVLAVAGIVVDAKDAAAGAFYRHFGFVPLAGRPDRLLPAGALSS